MPVLRRSGDRVVLASHEALAAGGATEAFERRIQQLLRDGHRNLVIDLSAVPSIDSGGIRSLVRAHTSAQRIGGTLRLAALSAQVRRDLEDSNLFGVFDIHDSVETARLASLPWRTIRIAAFGALLCGALVWAGLTWPNQFTGIGEGAEDVFAAGKKGAAAIPTHPFQPFIELLKLIAA